MGRIAVRAPVVLLLALTLCGGCATIPRHEAVPFSLVTTAEVVGIPDGLRYFPRDVTDVRQFEEAFVKSWERERTYRGAEGGPVDPLPPAAFLAISGGGDNGAFGAGLLNGWTAAGTRPEFKLVTGVSTGALIAPFAFLGPAYDDKLKQFYTGVSINDIAKQRSLLSAFYGDSLADTTPLFNLLKKYVTQDLLDAIAAEHEKGRMLLIGTTDLDAQRPVIWNITEIAATRRPGTLDLVRKILLASAAIPGTFSPVMINVHVGEKLYEEMHVDGGTANQVFIYPSAAMLAKLSAEHHAVRERTLYVIRNARLDPGWAQVERRTLTIAFKSIVCLIQNQGIGDLYRIYSITQRDNIDFRLAFIPATFDTPHTQDFDTVYMKKLFEFAYEMGTQGHAWVKSPPVLLSGGGADAPQQDSR